ncbi:hypothetical protein ACFFRR_008085 [Megaselia abdita]
MDIKVQSTVKMLIYFTFLIIHACGAGTIPATPENITLTFISPSSVQISWQTTADISRIEKYLVQYKPANDRVIRQVAGNTKTVVLDNLIPSTQYSVTVQANVNGIKYRSRSIIFRTMDTAKITAQQDLIGGMTAVATVNGTGKFQDESPNANNNSSNSNYTSPSNSSYTTTTRELPPIRGVEVGIVLIVLMVWAGAIALFFNRWGKIRMLLPYQPDYKHEQLKVPGTGVCTGSGCNGQHSHQHFHLLQEEPSTAIDQRCTRSRINSAIFVSSEGRGFDSIEFLRRHGSQSVLCRKARSAENITDDDRKRSFSENRQWATDDSQTSETVELTEVKTDSPKKSSLAALAAAATTTLAVVSCSGNSNSSSSSIYNNNNNNNNKTSNGCGPNTVAQNSIGKANTIVGSISIETPPPHIQLELKQQQQLQQQLLKLQQQQQQQTQQSQPPQQQQPLSLKPIKIVGSTIKDSPVKKLELININRPNLTNLPILSVSGPSPPADSNKDFL